MKIANSFQSELPDTASTIFPIAASFDATHAFGVQTPGRVPFVWSSLSAITMKLGTVPARSISLEFFDENVDRLVVANSLGARGRPTPGLMWSVVWY